MQAMTGGQLDKRRCIMTARACKMHVDELETTQRLHSTRGVSRKQEMRTARNPASPGEPERGEPLQIGSTGQENMEALCFGAQQTRARGYL